MKRSTGLGATPAGTSGWRGAIGATQLAAAVKPAGSAKRRNFKPARHMLGSIVRGAKRQLRLRPCGRRPEVWDGVSVGVRSLMGRGSEMPSGSGRPSAPFDAMASALSARARRLGAPNLPNTPKVVAGELPVYMVRRWVHVSAKA